MSLGFAIDRGGTFTDVIVFKPNEEVEVLKVLSVDPSNYADAPTEAIRQVLERESGKKISRGIPLPTESISWIRMGTTVATNALLERKGERIGLLITKGFKDLLFIGNQSRPKIFDFDIQIPEVLYEDVIEVDERVLILEQTKELVGDDVAIKTAINGMKVVVEKRVDEEELKQNLKSLKKKGIKSVAVLFLHSFIFYPTHEKRVGAIAKASGFDYVSLSHEVMPMIKVVPRGFTVCADAYLTPKIMEYLDGFQAGFTDLSQVRVNFMQSDGGLCEMKSFRGSRAILSGPAGGVVGIASTAYKESDKKPVIGFDMGGTSTDVCRYSGHLEHVMETTTAGITIQAPQVLDIRTVAAGGGSRLFFRDGLLIVGPESASAHPGPVCYRKNGYLTVTDANLVLGRILPEYFPKIFGPNADQPLDKEASYKAMEDITERINAFTNKDEATQKTFTVEEVALGFLAVANEEMCRPIRTLTQSRGFNPSEHVLACFGGAGGQHACAVAKVLGISQVRIHKYASLLSAYGIALADVVDESQTPSQLVYEEANFSKIYSQFMDLRSTSIEGLKNQGFSESQIETKYFMHMRYEKTDTAIMISWDVQNPEDLVHFNEEFRKTYRREFGFVLEDRNIIIDDVRIRTRGKSGCHVEKEIQKASEAQKHARPKSQTQVYFENCKFVETGVYLLEEMLAGQIINGPALLIDKNSTIVIEPSSTVTITEHGNVELQIGNDVEKDLTTEVDPIRLAIFSNRFMSIAEQMGRILQRTAISTNIKERLDFSCALFAPDGGLIANAPHIPVHLGGMQYTVKFQMIINIKEGDVYLANHPLAGGCHLPDFTVITPVFFKSIQKTPVFFVANRGHHADIGGLVPGSMPPNAHHIDQEGASFISFKLVDEGKFQEEALIEALKAPGKVPGCSGARNINDNIADLNAQIAANRKGIQLVTSLIEEYSLDVVHAYMQHIQNTAELCVREMLKRVGRNVLEATGKSQLTGEDYMDDGTRIQLTVNINLDDGSATFDFTGTGPESYSSCNAPRAVTMSAITYCLRCLVEKDVPLNNGCLAPIKIIIPDGTILSPSETAPVVAGNVLTSQRLCDVIFRTFDVVAASQGCMNNLVFGDEKCGYYETIAGGAGAGNGFDGRSGVHTHMTNTRITDPEILENRFPVVLREWKLREGSGGNGKWKGGDGVVRQLEFTRTLTMSLLTERRAFQPYGLHGGENGKRGLNLLKRSGRAVNIGSKASFDIHKGDILCIQTPGGGGYGKE
ncbi:Protein CBG16813 [Caenorhabditis briggsae]|uniref:Protein CBG16813 n=1 Tax=Caenorhabditis briggsae TaxID=6238 RepID=A8XPV1_CAEBR|nr:Protein CBG16813 [Caenorhabditis briggsae]CAP34677.2 Protein CBG16813 [Caenorhabditis briggsae]